MSREVFTSGPGRWSKKDIEIIQARLPFIRKRYGAVTAKNVLKDARDKASPLHALFDWDRERSIERDLLRQASDIIQAAYTIVQTSQGERTMRAWFNIKHNGERQYLPMQEVRNEASLASQVLDNAQHDLDGLLRRYELYRSIFGQRFGAHLKSAKKELAKKRA